MNKEILKRHIQSYQFRHQNEDQDFISELKERDEKMNYYQKWDSNSLGKMTIEDFSEYISQLWAMLIWGNKKYVINKIINDNGFDKTKEKLAYLLWGKDNIETRWDSFRKNIKGFGPAMMSELLSQTHPDKYMIWNKRALIGFSFLEVDNLPRYDYQCTGKKYKDLCETAIQICEELKREKFDNANLLTVDYFIYDELQIDNKVNPLTASITGIDKSEDDLEKVESNDAFIHDEIKNKLSDIGSWLGFDANTEVKVSEGSVVDTVWESKVGNMGRVIYVFEVQTKGSIDSMLMNLLRSLNNPAVQGIVAVSDSKQLEKIKRQADITQGLAGKLKLWDYKEVLHCHESLESVNQTINKLGLVPDGF